MLKDIKIWTHNPKSNGARLLANAMDCKIIKHDNSQFKGDRHKTVVNWGSSKVPDEVLKCAIINHPKYVSIIKDRYQMFKHLGNHFDVPAYTNNAFEAQKWIEAGACLFEKDGIYSWDVKPTSVIRLHQMDGRTIYVQNKAGEDASLAQGTKDMIKRLVEDVRRLLKLHFCAVTIGWVEVTNRAYILDVNTAPELDPVVASVYANNLAYLIGEKK